MNTQIKVSKKAFTLVELIVVITILVILGTIAFISLNWYNNDAKNWKVISDLRNLAWSLEVVQTTGSIRLINTITNIWVENTIPLSSIVNNSGATLWDSNTSYFVGNVNFTNIKQNWKNFKDSNSFDQNQDYIYAVSYHPDFAFFQFAGQIYDNDIKKVKLTWTYTRKNLSQDASSLISTRSNNTPVENNMAIAWDLYQ